MDNIPNTVSEDVESEHIVKDRTVYPDMGLTESFRLSVSLNAPPEKGQYIINYDPAKKMQEVFLVYPEAVNIPSRDERKTMEPGYASMD